MSKEQVPEAGSDPEIRLIAEAALIRFQIEQIMENRDRQEFIKNMNA